MHACKRLSRCRFALPLVLFRFANIFGISISETAMRPNPTYRTSSSASSPSCRAEATSCGLTSVRASYPRAMPAAPVEALTPMYCARAEKMKGSVMDAMSEAIEGAEVMLYCLCKEYKESANCRCVRWRPAAEPPASRLRARSDIRCCAVDVFGGRLEANYGHQMETDMIPLMLEQGYRANGWLGLILGTRMYYEFTPAVVSTETDFLQSIDALAREIGDRGKPKLREAVAGGGRTRAAVEPAAGIPPPARTPASAPSPAWAPALSLVALAVGGRVI